VDGVGSVDDVGSLDCAGSDGTLDGELDPGDTDGVDPDPSGGSIDRPGVPLAAAICVDGVDGATTPAVNATAARMRFRTPNETTRRARCAAVTIRRDLP
jgi:hypothetical protein